MATLPGAAKHVAVIGDGDGRLARAIKTKLGAGVRIFVVEPRVGLHKYLADFVDVGTDPWAVSAFEEEAQRHGPFDFLVFYGLHEYWRGQLRRFQQIIAFAHPNTPLWVTFVNSSALRYIDQVLPPLRLSADALGSASRFWAKIDYASWMAYSAMLNVRIESVWGLLDNPSFQFCQSPVKDGSVEWEIKGAKIQARTPAEIIHWGAAYVGIQQLVHPDPKATSETTQALGGAAFSPQLFQTLVDPFPETGNEEPELAWAETELRAARANRDTLRPGHLVEFVLGLIEDTDAVRDVLVLGAGWGRDVYLIRKARPQWHCAGVECSKDLITMGADFCKQEGLQVEAFTLGDALPFADKSFDVVLSLGFMSKLYDQAALAVVQELLRVGRKGVYHLEDGRGPEQAPKLKHNSLIGVYAHCGHAVEPKPVLIQGQDSGFIFCKVAI